MKTHIIANWTPSRSTRPTELRRKQGEPVPQWLELEPDAMLGIEPIEVAFTRDGNRLVGTVPTPERPGPPPVKGVSAGVASK